MTLFPMFMKLEGRSSLVVGAGSVGEPKIGSLIASGASVRVIALQASPAVAAWAREGSIVWEQRAVTLADLDGAFLVIAATNDRKLNAAIFAEARQRNILCNVVDDPEYCDFYYPAVVRRGELQLAISTNGLSPALAQRIRRELELQFGPEYGPWLEELGRIRKQLFASRVDAEIDAAKIDAAKIDPEKRRLLLHELASRAAFEEARSSGFNAAEFDIEAISLEKIS